ncbi:RNA polymerase sigma factor [Winogradskyella sp. R77965]|uniref:RNA polymerase sigma factor n=1 Tax=Winogradskyella sp. R77965 TaxID=3093872 RepID=UPI0037DCD8D2
MDKKEFKHTIFSLSERLFPMVSRMLGTRANAEDAIQDIMLKLWVKRKQIAEHPNIIGLVFSTARNHCIDILRKKKLDIYDAAFQLEIVKSEHGREALEWKELNTIIKQIVTHLPEQQREVILMRDLDGYEFVEIAAATQLKIEHVRVLLSRARKQVSIELEKTYSYERR